MLARAVAGARLQWKLLGIKEGGPSVVWQCRSTTNTKAVFSVGFVTTNTENLAGGWETVLEKPRVKFTKGGLTTEQLEVLLPSSTVMWSTSAFGLKITNHYRSP